MVQETGWLKKVCKSTSKHLLIHDLFLKAISSGHNRPKVKRYLKKIEDVLCNDYSLERLDKMRETLKYEGMTTKEIKLDKQREKRIEEEIILCEKEKARVREAYYNSPG